MCLQSSSGEDDAVTKSYNRFHVITEFYLEEILWTYLVETQAILCFFAQGCHCCRPQLSPHNKHILGTSLGSILHPMAWPWDSSKSKWARRSAGKEQPDSAERKRRFCTMLHAGMLLYLTISFVYHWIKQNKTTQHNSPRSKNCQQRLVP